MGERLTQLLKAIGERSQAAVRVGNELGEWFPTTKGTRQGDPLSPCLFITYLERVLDEIQDNSTDISIHGEKINNIRFSNDIGMIEESIDKLEESVRKLDTAGRNSGLKINTEKTKTMMFGRQDIEKRIKVGSTTLKNVGHFVYLGSVLTWDR